MAGALRWIVFSLALSCIVFEVSHGESECMGSTCQECINSRYICSWCIQKDFNSSRCETKSILLSQGCDESLIQNPTNSLQFTEDVDVGDEGTNGLTSAIQVQPQKVLLKTRQWKETTFSLTFRAANNYPVDLYFLFDNSKSMVPHFENLAKLASDIGQSIKNISSNFQMGYGVFQDKVILPFTDTTPIKLTNPCYRGNNPNSVCAPPFEFKHLLSMTNNVQKFKNEVKSTEQTGNLDHPEGSLDAIMQAVSCKSEIQWRQVGRKMLIFASNDRFHVAGDGKLAGIVTPNDGQCHLDVAGRYSKELEQDYPSVSQVMDAVNKNEMHIIFVVSEDQRQLFDKLAERIPRASVELLADPSGTNTKNIKQIIENKYRTMSSEVKIVHDEVKGVDIEIKATSKECEVLGGNICKGKEMQIGKKIQFEVKVKVTECPDPSENKKKLITIYPDSHKNDKLLLEIEVLCDCDCNSDRTTWEMGKDVCTNGNGTLKCGLCDCEKDRYGQFCQCDSSELDSSNSGCIRPNTTEECSSAGRCECGVCNCDEGRSGTYCECIEGACGLYQGEVCGGARGRCVCNLCECAEGYKGEKCEIITSNKTCIYEGTICNGHGVCENGRCDCEQGHVGEFCETCFLCGDDYCDNNLYRQCAQCVIDDSDMDCSQDCSMAQFVDDLDDSGTKLCSIKQADGCFIIYKLEAIKGSSNFTLLVKKEKTCPEPVDLLPIVAGVVGGVVALGLLLLLLWKIFTTCHDRVEYSKFEEHLKNGQWSKVENPFYKGATTTYNNPMLDPVDTDEPADIK